MVFTFPKRGKTSTRSRSTPEQMLEVITKACAEFPSTSPIAIKDLAAACSSRWPETADRFALFMRRKMTTQQRAKLNIRDPRPVKPRSL